MLLNDQNDKAMKEHHFTNRLIHETSPYLLQHAHNPVDWFPWGEEALERAKKEDKLILVSIGYSACHWCHVMERESFEDIAVAELMNTYFVNIKIDREERPDLDHIYMDAVQTISGSGGWPLNVFLTPGAKPFYGGTYYPPARAFNRVSWKELIESVHDAYHNRKEEILQQAEDLTRHLVSANDPGKFKTGKTDDDLFTQKMLSQIADNFLSNADTTWGGFGNAPKFPQTFSIIFLLRHYYFTGHQPALEQALLSLDKMMQGGIYDQLGGGFARYSTDAKWLAPHFEKMLYDNALLLTAYAEAYRLTGNSDYAGIIRATIAFVQTEMTSPEGGFYSAYDADSEGVEGKYYTWSKSEIDSLLGDDAEIFCVVYGVTEKGNWEHTNILHLPERIETVAAGMKMSPTQLSALIIICKKKLLAQRTKRTKPLLDDKILLGWNALMITALCKCYAALGDAIFIEMAEAAITYLETNMKGAGGWGHSYKRKGLPHRAFIDDLAALVNACICLQEATGLQEYLVKAKDIMEEALEEFNDESGTLFYYTAVGQHDVIVRKKEIYDGATPSGNAMMSFNLLYLALVFNRSEWRERAVAMIGSVGKLMERYPASFGYWALNIQALINGIPEIAVVGSAYNEVRKELLRQYIPVSVLQSCRTGDEKFPVLAGKYPEDNQTLIYVCSGYRCLSPTQYIADAIKTLRDMKF